MSTITCAIILLALVSCALATNYTVKVGDLGSNFNPPQLQIQPGDTVMWVWITDGHSVKGGTTDDPNAICTSGPSPANFVTATQQTGYNYSYTFNTVGVYNYYCVPHCYQGMVGQLTVGTPTTIPPTPAPTTAAPATPAPTTAAPATPAPTTPAPATPAPATPAPATPAPATPAPTPAPTPTPQESTPVVQVTFASCPTSAQVTTFIDNMATYIGVAASQIVTVGSTSCTKKRTATTVSFAILDSQGQASATLASQAAAGISGQKFSTSVPATATTATVAGTVPPAPTASPIPSSSPSGSSSGASALIASAITVVALLALTL